jgi:hypothetical protein
MHEPLRDVPARGGAAVRRWLVPPWFARQGFTGRLAVGLLALCVATGGSAVTALVVTHHSSGRPGPLSALAHQGLGPLPAAPADPVAPLSPPAGVTQAAPVHVPGHSRHLVSATLLVTSKYPLSQRAIRRLRRLDGVRRVQPLIAGHARVDGHPAMLLGVNPVTFRAWTPQLTAASNPLWDSVSQGSLAASYDMGENANLPLGGVVPVRSRGYAAAMRIGAFASVGMAGVDGVVSGPRARELGLAARTGALVSAPDADPLQLRRDAADVVGQGAHVSLLREVIITRDAGEFLTRVQIYDFLHAAASRIGLPYVWGGAGPNDFDCSGLVQWAFAQAGIRMPRVSEEQWLTGPHIPPQDARPGDLLFWHYDPKDPTDIDHVAIYMGNGMMIVAPHTGEYVEYVPVPYNDFAGVVRVDPVLGAELS